MEQLEVVVNRLVVLEAVVMVEVVAMVVEEDAGVDVGVDVEADVEEVKTNQLNRNITYKLYEQVLMFIFFCIISFQHIIKYKFFLSILSPNLILTLIRELFCLIGHPRKMIPAPDSADFRQEPAGKSSLRVRVWV